MNSKSQSFTGNKFIFLFAVVLSMFFSAPAFSQPPWIEDMTWQEIADALKEGKTTVIIPTGGTEQAGLHIVTGKHNFILKYTAREIANKLGNTLIAPIIAYVPEGDINPPSGHMRFPGTLSVRPEIFAAMLEDTARSLKQHGFKFICFVGESGGNQQAQAFVAQKLSQEWQGEGVKVIHVNEYYDEHNGQVEWAKEKMEKESDIQAHGGTADTSEMLFVHPLGVRENFKGKYTAADFDKVGVNGSSETASMEYGKKFIELKIEAAVRQISKERQWKNSF